MKKHKKTIILILHIVFVFVLIALHIPMITGVAAHEIMAIVFMAMLTAHVILCRRGYASIFKPDKGTHLALSLSRMLVVVAAAILCILMTVSGIAISQFIFSRNISPQMHAMHSWTTRLMLVFLVAHIFLNLKSISKFFAVSKGDDNS